jgi:hypothetical protein
MNKHVIRLLATFLFIILLTGCKKDNNQDTSGYRIISDKYYYEGSLYFEGTYQYSGNKVSDITITYSDSDYEEYLFEYPNENKIIVNGSGYFEGETGDWITEINLADNKVIEVINSEDKTVFTYNSSGQIEEDRWYIDMGTGWELFDKITYTYSSGKLIQVIEDGKGYKSIYTYNGDNIDEEIVYRKVVDTWVYDQKWVYTYTSGNLKELEYIYTDGSWVEGGVLNYKFDNSGNLIEESSKDFYGDGDWIFKFTYEEGIGNFRQVFYATDWYWYDDLLPTKKSSDIEKEVRNQNRENILRLVSNHSGLNKHFGLR